MIKFWINCIVYKHYVQKVKNTNYNLHYLLLQISNWLWSYLSTLPVHLLSFMKFRRVRVFLSSSVVFAYCNFRIVFYFLPSHYKFVVMVAFLYHINMFRLSFLMSWEHSFKTKKSIRYLTSYNRKKRCNH